MTGGTAYLAAIGAGRGSNPELLVDELRWFITEAITNHPRSLQKAIGPSEIGHPCARRIGYKLLDFPTTNRTAPVPWKATVGTAVHGWLEKVFSAPITQGRFITEGRVTVGKIGGRDVDGNTDLYDTVTATVIDWKVPGPTPLRTYRAKRDPGEQYRKQAHLYGAGWEAAGYPVDRVMVVFLPRNGELDDMYVWHEPYFATVARDALNRAEAINTAVTVAGPAALNALPTADAYCSRCPWFNPGSTNPAADGCPGDPSSRTNSTPPAGPPFGAVPDTTERKTAA